MKKVLVTYATLSGSTVEVAQEVARGIEAVGMQIRSWAAGLPQLFDPRAAGN
jgi:flavodoxin